MMDLECANEQFSMNFDALLKADDFNFGHDIIGLQYNIDRKAKRIMNCFLPRCAR